MNAVLNFVGTLESVGPCCQCGVEFAMPSAMKKKRINDHREFFCPNGHSQIFADGPVEKLKRELAEKERQLAAAKANQAMAENRASAAEVLAQRAKAKLKRVKVGVCPCCKRTVRQLAAHMKTKHPDFEP